MAEDTQTTTVVTEQSKTTANYAVYESPDLPSGQALTGMYVTLEAFPDEAPEHLEVEFSAESEEGAVPVTKDKETSNFVTFSSEGGTITGMYVSHGTLEAIGARDAESIGISIDEASADEFEAAEEEGQEQFEEEAEQLLG